MAVTLAAVAALPVAAQDLPTTEGYKIGVVDRSNVFENYKRQDDEFSKLETEKAQREEELQSLINGLEADLESYRDRRESMSAEEREKFEIDFKSREREVAQQKETWQSELTDRTSRVIRSIQSEIFDVIQEIGTKGNYHLILEADQDPRAQSDVVYFSTTIDVTQQVIDRLNEKYANGGKKGD